MRSLSEAPNSRRAGLNLPYGLLIAKKGPFCPVIFGSKSRNSLQRKLIQNVRLLRADISIFQSALINITFDRQKNAKQSHYAPWDQHQLKIIRIDLCSLKQSARQGYKHYAFYERYPTKDRDYYAPIRNPHIME